MSAATDQGARAPDPMASQSESKRTAAVLVYLLLLVSLQIFLLVVAVEGLLGDDPAIARTAALLSTALFLSALALRWFLGER